MENVHTVETIAILIANVDPSRCDVIYVEGYWEAGDGGGGMFRFDRDNQTQPDLGVNFISSHVSNVRGRWVRQYYGHLNVAYFGIVKHPDYDVDPAFTTIKNHERLQNAIDYCHRNSSPETATPPAVQRGDFTIYFPEGVYWFQPGESIIIRSRTHLKGDPSAMLRLLHVNLDFMFRIDSGSVQRVRIEELKFDLLAEFEGERANATGWLNINAIAAGHDNSGGLFDSVVRNVYVENVGNHGVVFQGGDDRLENSGKCNQFIYFDNVWVERRYDYMNSFRLRGQNCNISFINCNPLGSRYFNEDVPTLRGACWDVSSNAHDSPLNNENIFFIGCDAGGSPGQPGEFGFFIENAQNIFIENCWIEDSEYGIIIKNSEGVSILDNHFANAAANGSRSSTMLPTREGSCIICENSTINVERNHVTVSDVNVDYVYNERFIRGFGENNVINSTNNYFDDYILAQTYGVTQNVYIEYVRRNFSQPVVTPPPISEIPGIDAFGKKVIMLKMTELGPRDVYRINSTLNAGETLYLFANDADVTFHAIDYNETEGKNIGLGGMTEYILKQGKGATFLKVDGVNGTETATYQLISTF